MRSTYACIRDSIVIGIGVTSSAAVQDKLHGGYLANDIFVEKSDEEGGGLAVYCSCWDTILGMNMNPL